MNSELVSGWRAGRTMPSRMSRDSRPSCSPSPSLGHRLKAGDGATAVDNKDRRASFKTIDEGAKAVFSLSDAGFFMAS